MIEITYRFDPQAPAVPLPTSPAEACKRLCQGSDEFAGMLSGANSLQSHQRVVPLDLRAVGMSDTPGIAPLQEPFAAVLSCSDARVPTELIFNQSANALFVVRVAGNVLGSECLGSLDYAMQHLSESVKLLVVLGHSGCGAVTAAVDAFLTPVTYLSLAASQGLRSIVDHLFITVRGAALAIETIHGPDIVSHPMYRDSLIELSIALNAAVTARTLECELQTANSDQIDVVYGTYDLKTRLVGLPEPQSIQRAAMLHRPPQTDDAFRELAYKLAQTLPLNQSP
jgi:carbonic anhydrase